MKGSTLPTGDQKKLLRAMALKMGFQHTWGRDIPGGKNSRGLGSGAWVGHHGDPDEG